MTATANSTFDQINDAFAALAETSKLMDSVLKSGERLVMVKRVGLVADRRILNRYCAQAMEELDTAICLVTLLDAEHLDIIGWAGAASDDLIENGNDNEKSLCQYVVGSGRALRVDDSTMYCSLVPGIQIDAAEMHAYYGEPVTVHGQVIGSFCALDDKPRAWSTRDQIIVKRWADMVARTINEALAAASI